MTLSQIQSWLDAPRPLTDAEKAEIDSTLKQYPYMRSLKLVRLAADEFAQLPGPRGEINPVIVSALRKAIAVKTSGGEMTHGEKTGRGTEKKVTEEPAPVHVTPVTELRKEEEPVSAAKALPAGKEEENLIPPFSAEDYFRQQGVDVSGDEEPGHSILPESKPAETAAAEEEKVSNPKSEVRNSSTLMVMMSFAEWLQHFKHRSEKEKEEDNEKRALKSHWQREKLAAALEEEEDEIPDGVFRMAVDSISREDKPASESLAEVLVRQGKKDAAIDMFRRLQLRNPAKSGYFAARIEALQKEAD